MFVTKRIHPGAFPMNGKFTRLLFLKTAKSKKRKTCRNIFFFRTMPPPSRHIFASVGPGWRRQAPVAPVAPVRLCLSRLLHAPAYPENKSGLEWPPDAPQNPFPGTKPGRNVPNTQGMHFPGTKPGRNVPTRHHLGTKKTENVPNTQEMHFLGTKPGRNVPTRHHLGTKKTENVPNTQKE